MKYDIQVIYGMCFFSYPSCFTWQQLKKSCGGGDAGSCFNNNGEFKGFDCFKANETELLAGTIGKQILKYVVDNGESAKRLIIHFYKKIKR